MSINIQIAFNLHDQTKATVLGKQLQHVIKKANAGINGNLTLIVKIQCDFDLCLFRSSVYRCLAHLISPPCQIWLQ